MLQSVREFGRAISARCGAPAGTLDTYIEVPFEIDGVPCRPDGLLRVSRGKSSWTALVEVKTGNRRLTVEQVTKYLEVARAQGFDSVITISNEITTTPGVHPLLIDNRKLKKVSLHHLSWSRIHTEALLHHANHLVSDPDQAWILNEFIRYLESPKAGTFDFGDMGEHWQSVHEAASSRSLHIGNPMVGSAVVRFDQVVGFARMHLSQKLGVHVRQRLTRAEMADPGGRIAGQCKQLANSGELEAVFEIPRAAAPVRLLADLRAGRIDVSAVLTCPDSGFPKTRVNWLLRQLNEPPEPLFIRPVIAKSRKPAPSYDWRKLLDSPETIGEYGGDIRSLEITYTRPLGTKRGHGQGSFVSSVTAALDDFYEGVMQNLKPWSPRAPKVQDQGTTAVVPTDQQVAGTGVRTVTTTVVSMPASDPDLGRETDQ